MPESSSARPARRDPAARRQAIVAAAADLLVESGSDITHRRVAERAGVPLGSTTYYFANLDELRAAALELIADGLAADLAEFEEQATVAQGDPAVLAQLTHAYLTDRHQLGADLALYGAALRLPEIRPLVARWLDGTVAVLSTWTDPATARLLGIFLDGAGLHAALGEEPLDLADITRAITALLRDADRPR